MVTTLYIGLLGLIYAALAFYTISGRFKYRIDLGHGDNEDMLRRVRAHGNFAEYVPITLVLILFAELEGTPEVFVHIMGSVLVVGRLMHAAKLSNLVNVPYGRETGMILTLLVIIAASLICIKSFFFL